jgi:hypothetical protein
MANITAEFLESKKFYYRSGWNGSGKDLAQASSQNINRLTDNVFTFTEYNFLSVDGSELDGHYTFFVNYKTFAYCFFKSSDYGSLTYTLPSDDTSFKTNMNDITRSIVESKIATKLLGAYFYDREATHSKGNFLISRSTGDNEDIVEYNRNIYGKRSLICDHRGYLWTEMKPEVKDEYEIAACKLIDPDFVEAINPRVKLNFKNRVTRIFKDESKDPVFGGSTYIEHFIPFTFTADNDIKRELWLAYTDSTWTKNSLSRNIGILSNLKTIETDGEKQLFGQDRCDFNLKKYIAILPTIVQSRYF